MSPLALLAAVLLLHRTSDAQTISCPADIIVNNDAGTAAAVITYDYTLTPPSPTTIVLCSTPTGAAFPIGTTTVLCSFTATNGVKQSCSFNVMVVDNVPPIITCPSDSTVLTELNLQTGILLWFAPTATDNIGGTPTVTCSQSWLSPRFALGLTTVNCNATDAFGKMSSCDFNVTVLDRQSPVIDCPNTWTQYTDVDSNSAVVTFVVNNYDNVGVVSFGCSPASGSSFPIGDSSVTCTATDAAGNIDVCEFNITVIDVQHPQFIIPSTITAVATVAGSATVTWSKPTATDNNNNFTPTVICNPSTTQTTFPIGANAIICTATDGAGNTTPLTFYIVVLSHGSSPQAAIATATCPNDVTDTIPPLSVSELVSLPVSFASTSTLIAMSTSYQNPTSFVSGIYYDYAATTDASGNTASCVAKVSALSSTTPPLLTCPSPIVQALGAGQNKAFVSWTDPTPISSWNVSLTLQPSYAINGGRFDFGNTSCRYYATDDYGNTAYCTFVITVIDTIPPVYQCPQSYTATTASSTTLWTIVSFNIYVTDNVGLSYFSSNINTGANLTVGKHTVISTARDTTRNTAVCTFTITVVAAALKTGSSSSTIYPILGGAVGGAVFLVFLIILIMWIRDRRIQKERTERRKRKREGLSDEQILARAKALQEAFREKRVKIQPTMDWLQFDQTTYHAPPKELSSLQSYLQDEMNMEISMESVRIDGEIGAGEFGSVCSGVLMETSLNGFPIRRAIAIKMLKPGSTQKAKFLEEAAIMAQFKHDKIVNLVGVLTTQEPYLICMEFMQLGSLKSYLESDQAKKEHSDLEFVRMACDVCSAMYYLGEIGFIHRDLAVRNVLMNSSFTCKVADFGLSIEVGEITKQVGDKIPIRWTAPEAVKHYRFSTSSDVWSFGILMWEMWSYAEMPYKGWNNEKVIKQVSDGYRLPNPRRCPEGIYSIMLDCWNASYSARPTFKQVFTSLLSIWTELDKSSVKGSKKQAELMTPAERQQQAEALLADGDDVEYDLGEQAANEIPSKSQTPPAVAPRPPVRQASLHNYEYDINSTPAVKANTWVAEDDGVRTPADIGTPNNNDDEESEVATTKPRGVVLVLDD